MAILTALLASAVLAVVEKVRATTAGTTRADLATTIFEYTEVFYNPVRWHSALDYRSPNEYARLHTTTNTAA